MFAVSSNMKHFGITAVFAALLAAIHVSSEKGCVFDFDNVSNFDLNCNDVRSPWIVSEDEKDSPQKNVLILSPEKEGCLKSKNTIVLNFTSPVTFRFYSDSAKNENKLSLRLIPKDGSCPDEECVWEIPSVANYKPGEWITAEHSFPLKSMKEFYVQVQVGKSKGKLLLQSMTFPSAIGDSSNCYMEDASFRKDNEPVMHEINLFDKFTAEKTNDSDSGSDSNKDKDKDKDKDNKNKKSDSPSLAELSKNLMLTSASVLTLNNLLN